MQINPLISLPASALTAPMALGRSNSPFKESFQKIADLKDYTARRAKAEDAAAGLVSSALILPVLKQLRRSPFNTEGPFSPGTGEKAFGPEFDMQLADRIAHSPRLGVKKVLADRLMKRVMLDKPTAGTKKELDVHG